MHACYFNFLQLIEQMRTLSIFVSTRNVSKLCMIPNYGHGVLSGIRFSLHANEAWGARLTFTLSSCLRLGTAGLGTNMNFICHQHGKLSRQRQHRRLIGKEYGIKREQHSHFGTVTVPFASYGHRGRGPAGSYLE